MIFQRLTNPTPPERPHQPPAVRNSIHTALQTRCPCCRRWVGRLAWAPDVPYIVFGKLHYGMMACGRCASAATAERAMSSAPRPLRLCFWCGAGHTNLSHFCSARCSERQEARRHARSPRQASHA